MSLHDCLMYARRHAPDNVIGELEAEKARLEARIAAADLMPYLSASVSGNMGFGRNIDPETNTYDTRRTLSSGFGVQLSLPLFDGLVSVSNLRGAHAARRRQQSLAQSAADEISLKVIAAFYNVFYCRAMVTQMEECLQRDRGTLAATERQEQAGSKSGADVAEMQAIVASDEYELTNQRNLLEKAMMQLKYLMGMPSGSELELTEDFPEFISAAELGSGGTANPGVVAAACDVEEGEMNLRSAKGSFSPRIVLNAGISTSYFRLFGSSVSTPGFARQWHDNMGEYVGFSLSLPLFTGLADVNRLKRARTDLLQRRMQLERKRYEVEKFTAEALLDLTSAIDELHAARKRQEAEEVAFRATQRRFELGDVSALDLYTSSAKLATARANLTGKRIQTAVSRLTLAYYRGENLLDITQ